jgi:hypothetical protein
VACGDELGAQAQAEVAMTMTMPAGTGVWRAVVIGSIRLARARPDFHAGRTAADAQVGDLADVA